MNIDVLYQIAIDRLDAQIKRIDGIDARTGMTFGLTNGITAALVAFIVFIPRPVPQLVVIFTLQKMQMESNILTHQLSDIPMFVPC